MSSDQTPRRVTALEVAAAGRRNPEPGELPLLSTSRDEPVPRIAPPGLLDAAVDELVAAGEARRHGCAEVPPKPPWHFFEAWFPNMENLRDLPRVAIARGEVVAVAPNPHGIGKSVIVMVRGGHGFAVRGKLEDVLLELAVS